MMDAKPRVFDQWAPRLIVLLVFITPMTLWLYMEDAFDLPKLSVVYSVDLVLVALWIRQALVVREIRLRRTALDSPIAFFLLVAALSSVFSIEPRLSWFGTYRIYIFGFIPMLGFSVLYWMTAQAASDALLQKVQTAAIISGALVSLYGVLQYTGNELFERMPVVEGGRVWSSLGNPIYLGAICMMAFLLVLAFLLRRRDASTGSPGVLYFSPLFMLLLMMGLAISLSRSAWIGTTVAATLLIAVRQDAFRQKKWVALVFGAGVVLAITLPGVRQRAAVLLSAHEGSNAARIAGWRAGVKVFRDHPLLGTGPDTFFDAFRPYRTIAYLRAAGTEVTQADAHNDLIQMAATGGALGLIAYLAVWVAFFRRWKPGGFSQPERIGFALALCALLIQNQFNFSAVSTSAWAAVFAGLLCVLPKDPERRAVSPLIRGALIVGGAGCLAGMWAVAVPWRADMAFKEGLGYAQQGDYAKAFESYRHAIDLVGGVEAYRTELVNTCRTLGKMLPEGPSRERYFDGAWQSANESVREQASNPDAWNNRGVAAMWLVQLAHRAMLPEAKESFEHAIRLDPVFVDAWANLAKWEHLAGHLDAEKELWHKVLEIDPQHPMALRVLQGQK